jgi:hypothetical protein
VAPSPEVTEFPSAGSRWWHKSAFAIFLLGYFWYFSWDSLWVHFAPDDMMNMASAWRTKPIQLLLAQLTPWSAYHRPLGALFYSVNVNAFGLNSVPFHVELSLMLLVNVYLIYRFGKLLGAGEIPAGLAAMLACYHAGMMNLYYNIAYSYDVLCAFFYLAAFVYYLRIRQCGRLPGAGQLTAILGLYLCALNSKEMAATFPILVLTYEWIYHTRPTKDWKDVVRWLRGPGRVAAITMIPTLMLFFGMVGRPDGLAHTGSYRLDLSPATVLISVTRLTSDLLARSHQFRTGWVVAIWALMLFLAWRRNSPVLRFCSFVLLITPIPIMFFAETRGGACLYIPFVGLAIFASTVFVEFASFTAKFMTRALDLRRIGRQRLFAAVVVAGAFLWARQINHIKNTLGRPTMAQLGRLTDDVTQQFRTLNPHVRPHSTVVFLNDPFVDWDMTFICELWFRDRGLNIHLQRMAPLPPESIALADHVFDYRDGKLIQVR